MRTTGARGPDAWTVATIVPSGAASMRYQTVASIRPHFDTCGSSRSTVASTVVPCVDAGNEGRSWASARLSFGGGAASAGAAKASATSAVSKAFIFLLDQNKAPPSGNTCQGGVLVASEVVGRPEMARGRLRLDAWGSA